jgi:leucine dehydrogenase
MWSYPSAGAAVKDAKRLARSMTFKAAVAGLPLGGAKSVIALRPGQRLSRQRRNDVLTDFAELVESFGGRYVTAQDVGMTADDIVFLEGLTDHVAGRPIPEGGSGDPSPYTAHGVEVAIRASLRAVELKGRHIVVIGLGHVGGALAERLARAGARLTVTDIDARKRAVAERLGASWVAPDEGLSQDADVLAPCALGGCLDAGEVTRLGVPLIAGAANAQLADESVAERLRERGIVWAPDFVANAGGLIAVADELNGFDRARVDRAITAIGGTLTDIYARAAASGTNTLVAARALAAERSPLH